MAQQVGGRGVAQGVTADGRNPQTLTAGLGYQDHGLTRDTRRLAPAGQEQRPTRRDGTPEAQVVHQRLADITWQRETVPPSAFAVYQDLARPPVDVFELHPGGLDRSQPEPDHQSEDGVIPHADRGCGTRAQ